LQHRLIRRQTGEFDVTAHAGAGFRRSGGENAVQGAQGRFQHVALRLRSSGLLAGLIRLRLRQQRRGKAVIFQGVGILPGHHGKMDGLEL